MDSSPGPSLPRAPRLPSALRRRPTAPSEPQQRPPSPKVHAPRSVERRAQPIDPWSETELRPFPWTGLTILIVVVALVAMVAVPQRPLSPEEIRAQETAFDARMALGELRAAIREYQFDHGVLPGVPPSGGDRIVIEVATETWLRRQLTMNSNAEGETLPQDMPSHPFGPYLESIPANPANGLESVNVLRPGEHMPMEAEGSHGWIYDPRTGEVRLDAPGLVPGTQELYFRL